MGKEPNLRPGQRYSGFLLKMEGQLSLFPEEQESSVKTKKKKKEKNADPSQEYDERKKRFWHYMEYRGMDERWIETCEGDLKTIIDALADYHDIASKKVETMETGYLKAVWEIHLEKIKKIQKVLEKSTGYCRDGQLEKCMKNKQKKDNDIGEDALTLLISR